MDRKNTATFVLFVAVVAVLLDDQVAAMTASEKNGIKLKVLEMFDHAYGSYMNHAYPADELMPLSCKGRYKGTEPSRGDIDDTLGNFTLTLIDSLDTLAVLGKVEEFEQAVRLVIRDARFDCDTIVSVFETNIRVLGGLLGGHVVASYLKKKGRSLLWYNSELLEMAREVGDRLLPAFNTSTGIPYPRINLKKGIAESIFSQSRDTCTACAGTMLLEFAALSRLTGDPKYEEKARKAMDYLWQQRHRTSDLMGLVINIHNGDWIRRESGVGAGFDSYYEYVLKSYILLGDETYLDRFNKHYDAVMRYVSQGPLLIDVHMHKPMAASRNFMDALLAFWPGLQVLKGDIGPAVETHEMLYQVIQRHNFLPEAFTNDFRIHWSHHPLRPEFVESTYFLFKATGDHHYLDVGRQVVENLDKLARVPCGFAALKDVTTNRHEDQMDSYVLAETFKYLFLLFAEKEDLILNIDDYIFTTEAHILPLTLSVHNSTQVPKIRPEAYSNLESIHSTTQTSEVHPKTSAVTSVSDGEEYNMCPNFQGNIAAGSNYAEDLRSSLKNLVNKVSPRQPQRDGVRIRVSTVKDGKKLTQTIHPKPQRMRQRLLAAEFIAGNKDHLDILHQMGIRIATMSDGRIQLLHTASEAATPEDAEDGMKFMQEMIELSKTQSPETQHDPMYVQLLSAPFYGSVYYKAGPAQFGYDLKVRSEIQGKLGISSPFRACKTLTNSHHVDGKIALLERGDCMFVDKARNLQKAGAIGGIVIDQNEGSTSESQTLFAMSGDGQSDISIPLVFLFKKEGAELIRALSLDNNLEIVLTKETRPTAFNKPQPSPPTGPKVPPFPNDNPEDLNSDHIPDQVPPMHGEPLTRAEGGERIGLDEVYTYQTNSQNVRLQIKVTGEMDTSTFNEVLEEGEISEEGDEGEGDTLNQAKNVLQLDTLPDGSKQLSFQIEKKLESGKNQPELNQIYVDLVQTLQETTNFERLNNQGDYLIAIARFLESAYFGMDRVDSKAQELIERLSQELKFLQYKSPVEAVEGNLKQEHMDFEKAKELHYASANELYETTSETRSGDHKQYVTTEESDGGFGARVNEDGVLVFKVEQDNSLSQDEESIESDPLSSNDLLDDSEFVPSSIEVETKGGFLKTTERKEKGEVVRTLVRNVDPSYANQHTDDSQVTEETGNIEGSEDRKQKDEL